VGNILGEANCIKGFGEIARLTSDYVTARVHFERARSLYRKVGNIISEAESTIRIGQVDCTIGNRFEGLSAINAGFSLYFRSAHAEDRAIPGWQAIHRALTADDELEAKKQYQMARVAWEKIGQRAAIRAWIDS
jgi:hypothetical protein